MLLLISTGVKAFGGVLEQVRRRHQLVVVGYVVMPEHIHLLIGEPQEKKPIDGDAGAQTRFCAASFGRGETEAQPGAKHSV